MTQKPGSGARASASDNLEQLLRRGMETFSRGDYEKALGFFHPDVEIDSSAAFEIHGPYRGVDGVREFYASIADAFEEFRVEPAEIRISGDRVLVIAKTIGRLRDSEETLVNDEYALWTIRDGQAIRLEMFFDRFEAEAAFDAEPDSGKA